VEREARELKAMEQELRRTFGLPSGGG
jgi:hypothetical protein